MIITVPEYLSFSDTNDYDDESEMGTTSVRASTTRYVMGSVKNKSTLQIFGKDNHKVVTKGNNWYLEVKLIRKISGMYKINKFLKGKN